MTSQTVLDEHEDVAGPVSARPRRRALRAALAALSVLVLVAGGVHLLRSPQPYGQEGSWDIAFEEEFSGGRLDGERWADHEPWESDGYALDEAWAPVPHDDDQLEVAGGRLTLKARRAAGQPQDKAFTSSSVNSRGRFSLPESGTSYVEARLKAPSSRGLLPAFWLLGDGSNDTGDGWPIKGEVDILEFSNNRDDAGKPFFSVWYPRDVHSSPPGSFLNGAHDTHPDSFAKTDLADEWHVWGLYRSPDKLEVFIDGEPRFAFRPGETLGSGIALPDVLFTAPMHLRLSLAVGGDWAGGGLSPADYQEGDLEVDYVRAWNAAE